MAVTREIALQQQQEYYNELNRLEAIRLGLNLPNKEEESTNPKDLVGIKKPPIHLVPPIQEILTSLAFSDGAEKYGPFNWREKKVKYSIYYAAVIRHLKSAYDGEDIDPKSKVLHLSHASACIAILMDAMTTGNLIDDRPKPGASARIIEEYTNV